MEALFGGNLAFKFLEPSFHFSYPGFAFVKPPGAFGIKATFWALAFSALVFASGYLYRVSALTTLVLFSVTVLWDLAYYNNHYYFIFCLGLLFLFCEARGKEGPSWMLDLFRYQVVLVYFFAGLAKLNPDWLLAEPLTIWLGRRAQQVGVDLLANPDFTVLLSYGGLLLDLWVGPALLWSRTRYLALALLTVFHLSNAWLFDIGIFPPLMLGSGVLFLGPLTRRSTAWRTPGARLALVWLLLQVVVPLRHLVIPGPVAWTEEGHRYSWRMKLRSKQVTSLRIAAGEQMVSPHFYLNTFQMKKMGSRPQLIAQFARHLSSQYPGQPIRFFAKVSLNGRPPQLLVDPTLDLATAEVPWALGHAEWINPLAHRSLNRPSLRPLLCLTFMGATLSLLGVLVWAIAIRVFTSAWLFWGGLGALSTGLFAAYAMSLNGLCVAALLSLATGRWIWGETRLEATALVRCSAILQLTILGLIVTLNLLYGVR